MMKIKVFLPNRNKFFQETIFAPLAKFFSLVCLIAFLNMSSYEPLQAQCPMCRMSAESNLRNGGTAGKGLNQGILYMLLTPYLLIGGLAFVWYKNRRKEEEISIEEQE